MTRSHNVLGIVFVALFGIYGCSQAPLPWAGADRAPLEARVQRLEEDFRTAAAARDAYRQKLAAAEEKLAQTLRQLDQATAAAAQDRQDREAARAEAKARTAERDNLQAHFDGFRKNIKELLGQTEGALNSAGPPPVFITTGPAPVPTAPMPALVGAETAPAAATAVRN